MSNTQKYTYDICIVGAGVVGSAVAAAISTLGLRVLVVESAGKAGEGTTSRNSEVIHSGLYYPAGSLKAVLCVRGRRRLYEIAARAGIAHRKIGKLIVAVSADEVEDLESYLKKGERNDVEGLRILTAAECRATEPHVSAVAALLVPETGIVSAHELCNYFFHTASTAGADFAFRTAVISLTQHDQGWSIVTDSIDKCSDRSTSPQELSRPYSQRFTTTGNPFEIRARMVVNAAGLHSDAIAQAAGMDVESLGYRLHWLKGSYFSLPASWGKRISRLIYPLPEKQLRSLGVHATLDLNNQVRLGPDTEECGQVEDYAVNPSRRSAFFSTAKRYLPELREEELTPQWAGIRPKLTKPGEPIRDFIITEESKNGFPGLVNLIGIESPGLTSSPAIADYVRDLVEGCLD